MLSDCIKLIIAAVRLQLRSYPANRAAAPPAAHRTVRDASVLGLLIKNLMYAVNTNARLGSLLEQGAADAALSITGSRCGR